MSSTEILNKLIILYILKTVGFPLQASQLCDCVIENNYMDYFLFNKELENLLNINCIKKEISAGKSLYSITKEGTATLKDFKDSKLSPAIQDEITTYLQKHGFEFRSSNYTTCTYDKNRLGDYDVQCMVKDGENVLLNLTISVPNEAQAIRCTQNWRKNKEDIFTNIMKKLL